MRNYGSADVLVGHLMIDADYLKLLSRHREDVGAPKMRLKRDVVIQVIKATLGRRRFLGGGRAGGH